MMSDMTVKKKIIILGSTGSIGCNTLKVVESFPDRFDVVGLAAGSDYRALADQVSRFAPRYAAMADTGAAGRLRQLIGDGPTTVLEGADGITSMVTAQEIDMVVSAIVGSAGLPPTFRAVEAGIDVALANKEPLVMAGRLITGEAVKSGSAIIPVDSEHHAVFTALRGLDGKAVDYITLTASGGPFAASRADLEKVTVEEALKHPRWNMGSKISIDSASLMNKGLEIIEAHWLFGLENERIRVVIHPESIVHAMVHLVDGGILAYLSRPDMKLPIAAALNFPEILGQGLEPLNLESIGTLTFMPPDHRRFPSINLSRDALEAGGTAPAVLNAANEEAVGAFLSKTIRFTDIHAVIDGTLQGHDVQPDDDLETIFACDAWARQKARSIIKGRSIGGRLLSLN